MQLNEEQKQQFNLLNVEARKTGRMIGFIGMMRIAAMCAIVIVLNEIFVKESVFVVMMSFVNGIVGMKMISDDLKVAQEKIQEKVSQILQKK